MSASGLAGGLLGGSSEHAEMRENEDTMIGTTGLQALRVDCIVGIYEHERQARQPVIVDVELDYDFAAAAASDAIADAVDYDGVATAITELRGAPRLPADRDDGGRDRGDAAGRRAAWRRA